MTQVAEPSPLTAAQRDARLRRDSGDLAGAVATLADAIERVRPVYGADHPEVLATAHLLARLHREAGEPAHARRVLEEAFAAGQRRFGDSDPLLLAISFDLGSVAEELGNRHEARRNFGRVASAGPAVLGENHWAVRAARDYLSAGPWTTPPSTPPPPAVPPPRAMGTTAPAPPPRTQPHPVPLTRTAPRRGRGAVVVAAVAAVAAVIAAVLAGIAVFRDGGGADLEADLATPTVSVDGEPPADVRVARDGDALVLTWTDPAPGEVSFVITGGRQGEELRFVGQLPSGERPRFRVHGYNPTLDYCFQIAAVYSTTQLGVAQPVCTGGTTAAPTR
jgi:hypothetical protein